MHILAGAGLGFVVGIVAVVVIAAVKGRRPTLKELALGGLAGAVAGGVTAATLGTGGTAAAGLAHKVVSFSGGGAAGSATDRVGRNAIEGRPLTEDLASSTAVGATIGGVIPVAGQVLKRVVQPLVEQAKRLPFVPTGSPRGPPSPALESTATQAKTGLTTAADDGVETVVTQGKRGLADVLENKQAGLVRTTQTKPTQTKPTQTKPTKPTKAPTVYATVHPPPPPWLQARFERAVNAVNRNNGPAASADDVRAFLRETYEHINEVNTLMKAMGGHVRPLPTTTPTQAALRGIHDFGERVSVRNLERFIANLRQNPLKTRDGTPLEVPAWLARLPGEARAAGQKTVDVGKLQPHIAAGLSRNGPPDPFAKALHNLAGHHSQYPRGQALLETIADRINAMRQVRIYRSEPLPFSKIEQTVLDDVAAGRLPPEAKELVRRGIEAQKALERSGQVNPYYLREPAPVEPTAPPTVNLTLGD